MHKLSYKHNPNEEFFNPTSPSYDDSALSSFHHHNAKKYYNNKGKQIDKYNILNTICKNIPWFFLYDNTIWCVIL